MFSSSYNKCNQTVIQIHWLSLLGTSVKLRLNRFEMGTEHCVSQKHRELNWLQCDLAAMVQQYT